MDTEVKLAVRKIFEDLRKRQSQTRSRKTDRVNVDQILNEFHERNSSRNKNSTSKKTN